MTRAGRAGDSQPMPVINDLPDIQSRVIADIERRRELGIERYGVALQPNNGRDALLDAYEEVIDLSMYLKQRLVEESDRAVSSSDKPVAALPKYDEDGKEIDYDGILTADPGAVWTLRPNALADMLARYLAAREHTLSTSHLTGMDQILAEAKYVRGEAGELVDAVKDMRRQWAGGTSIDQAYLECVRHELADVVLAATCLAGMLPGEVTVEDCIAEKTEADRGRG